ncbi:MAG: N-acetylmuramoyl-L-alanine amidase [Eubacteriales bacterium]|nr:N-acetylmuramoyl-L-alanine amidase [Eubacteriales bacterium]
MAVKIMIDAGHGGYDNGASYNGRREKDDALALALAVGEILQAQGYDVEYTRTDDVYDSPVQKARIGNASGADFFVSIHRNSSPTPNQYNGVQTLVFNDSGIKAAMARNVNNELEKVGYRNINVSERPNLAVLRRTTMPAILVEAGFINSDTDNNLFDTKFSQTAEAIAVGIDKTIREVGISATSMSEMNEDVNVNTNENMDEDHADNDGNATKYQILTGIYRSYGSASYQMNRFINEGYMAEIYEDEGLYQVRVGLYEDLEDAIIAQRILRDRGYDTLIVRA